MKTLTLPRDRDEWNSILEDHFAGSLDIYFKSGLLEVYAEQYEAVAEAVFFRNEEIVVFYPYLLRNIKKIPVFSEYTFPLYDITTPYGYGGPLIKAVGTSKEPFKEFRAEFLKQAQKRGIVTEFIRFHPVLSNESFFPEDVVSAGSVALVDLRFTQDSIMASFAKDKQRGIRKAERLGISTEFVTTYSREYMEEFVSIYHETMDKNAAEQKYYFTCEQLEKLWIRLDGQMFMVRALQDEECIASYLVFESGSFLTNYLSGHKVTANSTYAKYKVIWDLVVYGVGKGMSHYNLGGGRPSLLAFKSGFSNEIRPFYLGKRIILPQVYKDLLAIIGARSDESQFFPGYRTPELYPELM